MQSRARYTNNQQSFHTQGRKYQRIGQGGDAKNSITKNWVAKFKPGNPEELINWRIQLNHVIQIKP
eukprot:7529576-Ditylum_brightwellii.AAC.1